MPRTKSWVNGSSSKSARPLTSFAGSSKLTCLTDWSSTYPAPVSAGAVIAGKDAKAAMAGSQKSNPPNTAATVHADRPFFAPAAFAIADSCAMTGEKAPTHAPTDPAPKTIHEISLPCC